MRFVPMRDERVTILESCRHHYLWSGETNEATYNKIFVTYADTWCDHWSIHETSDANVARQQLLATTNWTREYWH